MGNEKESVINKKMLEDLFLYARTGEGFVPIHEMNVLRKTALIILAERDALIEERDALKKECHDLLGVVVSLNIDLVERGILLHDSIKDKMSDIVDKYVTPKNAETAIKDDKK